MSLDIWLEIDVDTGGPEPHSVTLFDGNYTHNVTPMWRKAGCYDALYKSDGKRASEVLPTLIRAVGRMRSGAWGFQKLNPENGWGDYHTALKFLEEFTEACSTHPKAMVRVSS